MKKNIQSLLKRDLEVIPLIAYFVFYFLYLFFDRILEQTDYSALVKPIIIPIIAYLYLTNKKSKRTFLNLFLLTIIFISDNSSLLEIRSFYIYATIIYLLSTYILLFYAITDMKLVISKQIDEKKIGLVLLVVFITLLFYCFFNFNPKEKSAEKFIVFQYMFVFMFLLLLTLFNYFEQKSKKEMYFFLTLLCMFLSDLFFSIHKYYNGHFVFKFLICFVEVPVYYFLLRYLLRRDKEPIEL